ncbi:TPA: conjugal transfer protein TraF [Vibrio cholerae]|uniref:conjugal transfer protein TraF n=1 Tax=Vibrio cholerae TaxID=666 RepID=UPI001583D02D|nr:conjugal transfer protein TraF [Vibrio cholerae]EJL6420422.1 conjugal transfer protein TraF [Vibrio cholerae]QKU65542.1 conjugal transfer protein TraF [Vibrio cholerae]
MNKILWLFLFFLTFSVSSAEIAEPINQKRGVFWGEIPKPEEKEKKEEKYPKPVIPPVSEMMKMHPKDIDKLREEALNYAVYTQSEEDVTNYWKIIDVVRRKSDGFVGVSGYVKMKNPDLNGNMDFPTNNPGRKSKLQDEKEELTQELKKGNKDYALLMFTQKGCSACAVQRGILENFYRETGWRIKEIDINEQPVAQAKFGITGTPITVLIAKKESENWLPVAIGTDSLSNLKSNIVRAVRILEGVNSPTQWYMNESQRGKFFDPNALTNKAGE